MYKDMYKEYSPENFEYSYPFCFNDNLDYLHSNNAPTYVWDYGDTVNIPFYIDKKYIGWDILLTIYNFRNEPIYQLTTYQDETGIIYLKISSDESEELFLKGLYAVGIQAFRYLLTDSTDEKNSNVEKVTIMPLQDCIIHVR